MPDPPGTEWLRNNTRMAMADIPPETPPSGKFQPGKTPPSKFLEWLLEPSPTGAPRPTMRPELHLNAVKNAARILQDRQGGISTIFIGDIKALLRESGLTDAQIDAAILQAAQAGQATLAQSSSVKITDQQKLGHLKVNGDVYHTVTFR